MKISRLKVVILAIVGVTAWPAMGSAESLAVRNCTWCHGASAQRIEMTGAWWKANGLVLGAPLLRLPVS